MGKPEQDIFRLMDLVVDSKINGALQAVLCGTKASYDFEGTGILLEFDSTKWLLTAAHVVDAIRENDHKMGITTGRSERNETILFFDLPGEILEDKENDIAIINLGHTPLVRLSNCIFIGLSDFEPFFFEKSEGDLMLVTGFPSYRAQKISPNKFRFRGAYYQTTENCEVNPYKSKEFPRHKKFLLNYSPELIEDLRGEGQGLASVHGFSGCPVWTYREPSTGIWNFDQNIKLVGIAIEEFSESKVFTVTRVSCIFQKMAELRPELEPLFDATWHIWR